MCRTEELVEGREKDAAERRAREEEEEEEECRGLE